MKKTTKIILTVLVFILALGTLFACGGKSEDGSIAIKSDAMPQLTHVLGEEIDLSGGFLEYTSGGSKKEVSLADGGVSISGYEKDKLGEQTVTVSYKGCTTTLTVTTVPRMVVEKHITEYLVDSAFDTSAGRVRITNNDGTNFALALDSEKITVGEYDFTTAGTKTVTVTYKSGSTVYSVDIAVTVSEADSATVKAPTKKTYNSHDTTLSLSGGAIVISGLGGKVEYNIPLDTEGVEITGFNPSAVTEESSPITQTITVTYKNHTLSFDITVNYSGVSAFNDGVNTFAPYSFTGASIPEITAEHGEFAVELMELYFSLDADERDFIDYEDALHVARCAFVYSLAKIDGDLKAAEGGFVIKEGVLSLTAESREGVEAAVKILGNKDSDMYRLSDTALIISEAFADAPVLDHGANSTVYFGSFAFADKSTYDTILKTLNHMLTVADLMGQIPDTYVEAGNWTHESTIKAIYEDMESESYIASGFGGIYALVDAWNPAVDVIDLMYVYYYAKQNDSSALALLSYVRFPSALDGIVRTLGKALDERDSIAAGYVTDATRLFYYYYTATAMADAVKKSENALAKELYHLLPVNGMLALDGDVFYIDDILDTLANGEGGVRMRVSGLLDSEEYVTLISHYMNILMGLEGQGDAYKTTDAYGKEVMAMTTTYLTMTPMQQYFFLSALNDGYSEGKLPLIFDAAGTEYENKVSLFSRLALEYYETIYSEGGYEVFAQMMLTSEVYARRFFYEGGYADFEAQLALFGEKLTALGDTDEANGFRPIYNLYLGYADMQKAENRIEDLDAYLGEWADEFLALQDALMNVEMAYFLNSQAETTGVFSYTTLISAFERASVIYDSIKSGGSTNALNALSHMSIYGLIGEAYDSTATYGCFDYTYYSYRSIYITYLLTATKGGIYDSYNGSPLKEFMNLANDAVWPYLWHALKGSEGAVAFDDAALMAAINAYAALDEGAKINLMLLESNSGYFYAARDAYLSAALTEDAAFLARSLFLAENDYVMYYLTADESYKTRLKSTVSSLEYSYTNLQGEDRESFEKLEHIYTEYIKKFKLLTA